MSDDALVESLKRGLDDIGNGRVMERDDLIDGKPKRIREDNLKIVAECNRLLEKLRRDRHQLPDGI